MAIHLFCECDNGFLFLQTNHKTLLSTTPGPSKVQMAEECGYVCFVGPSSKLSFVYNNNIFIMILDTFNFWYDSQLQMRS
jgi:hypothetical protein